MSIENDPRMTQEMSETGNEIILLCEGKGLTVEQSLYVLVGLVQSGMRALGFPDCYAEEEDGD